MPLNADGHTYLPSCTLAGLLSMPYAMRLSGWCGIGGLFLAATLFCISGKLIVRGFDKIPAGVPQSYSQLGPYLMR